MSLARPMRCLSAVPRSISSRPLPVRCIHKSARQQQDEPPKSASRVPALKRPQTFAEKARIKAEKRAKKFLKNVKGYTPQEWELLEQKYTPEQLQVIKTGEEAIDMRDVARQGALRDDPMSLNYLEDFSKIDPVLDKKQKPAKLHWDPNLRFKEEDEFVDEYVDFMQTIPEELLEDGRETELEARVGEFYKNLRMTVGKAEAELEPTDYSAPELPKLTDRIVRAQARASARDDGVSEFKGLYEKLAKKTGMDINFMKKLRYKVLLIKRVVNQTRLGKISSMYVMTVAGDGKGLLGVGEGKSSDMEEARKQAFLHAIRNIQPIPRYEKRTIFGDVSGKTGATELTLYTRPPGFGLRCQGKIYEMAKCAGISDLAAKVTRSRNPMNTVKACLKALLSQRDPEQIARSRGRKLVDVRKVYYSGRA